MLVRVRERAWPQKTPPNVMLKFCCRNCTIKLYGLHEGSFNADELLRLGVISNFVNVRKIANCPKKPAMWMIKLNEAHKITIAMSGYSAARIHEVQNPLAVIERIVNTLVKTRDSVSWRPGFRTDIFVENAGYHVARWNCLNVKNRFYKGDANDKINGGHLYLLPLSVYPTVTERVNFRESCEILRVAIMAMPKNDVRVARLEYLRNMVQAAAETTAMYIVEETKYNLKRTQDAMDTKSKSVELLIDAANGDVVAATKRMRMARGTGSTSEIIQHCLNQRMVNLEFKIKVHFQGIKRMIDTELEFRKSLPLVGVTNVTCVEDLGDELGLILPTEIDADVLLKMDMENSTDSLERLFDASSSYQSVSNSENEHYMGGQSAGKKRSKKAGDTEDTDESFVIAIAAKKTKKCVEKIIEKL